MEENKEKRAKEKKIRNRWWIIPAVLVALIIIFLLAVPAYLSSEAGNRLIKNTINDNVKGKADFSNLKIGYFSGISLKDFYFEDQKSKVKVKEIITHPSYISFLTGGYSLGDTTLLSPDVQINLEDQQPETEDSVSEKSDEKKPAGLPVKKMDLKVKDGNVTFLKQGLVQLNVKNINTTVNLNPIGKLTSFNLAADLSDDGTESSMSAEGSVKSESSKKWTWQTTIGKFNIDVNDLELKTLEPLFKMSGMNVTAAGNLNARIDADISGGTFNNLKADMKGKDIIISAPAMKGDTLKTQKLNAVADIQAKEGGMNINNLDLMTDFAAVEMKGMLPKDLKEFKNLMSPDTEFALQADLNVKIAELANQFSNTLNLKEGTSIKSGKLVADVSTKTLQGRKILNFNGELKELSADIKDKQVKLSQPIKANAQIGTIANGWKIEECNIQSSFASVDVTGDMQKISYTTELDLGKFQRELGNLIAAVPYDLGGQVKKEGELLFKKDSIDINQKSAFENLKIAKGEKQLTEDKIQIEQKLTLGRDKLQIDNIIVQSETFNLNIRDGMVGLGKTKDVNLNAEAKIDLGNAEKYAVFFNRFPENMDMSGRLDSSINVETKNEVYRVYSKQTKVKDLKIGYPDKEPFSQEAISIEFDMEIDPKNKVRRIKDLKIISPSIKIDSANFQQKQVNNKVMIDAEIKADYDWKALSGLLGPFLLPGLELTGSRQDTFTFKSSYNADSRDGPLSNAYAEGQMGFVSADYMGLNFGPTEFVFDVNNGVFHLRPFSSKVNGGKFNFEALIDFKKKPYVLRTPESLQVVDKVKINDTMSDKLLKFLNPMFANAVRVTGLASLYTEKLNIPLDTSAKDKMEIMGKVQMDEVYLGTSDVLSKLLMAVGSGAKGEEIKINPTDFQLKDSVLSYDNMKVIINENPLVFKGKVGLNKSINMSVMVPFTWSGERIKQGTEGGEGIEVPISGTVNKPELDMGKLLEQPIRDLLEKEIQKGLRDIFD